MYPEKLKYTKEHEWASVEGDIATVGITDFAQDSLGDVVYVELPKAGTVLAQNGEFGVVESVKTVSTLYSPLSGTVTEINKALDDSPALVNESPYEKAWMIKLKISQPEEAESLLSAEDYMKTLEK
ncbi:MAG: glycine cleavage system protein GcvH [bacterium]